MSTYGLVVIADVAEAAAAEALVERVTAVLRASWGAGSCPVDDLDYDVEESDLGVRVSISVPGMVTDHREADFFAGAPTGRAVICEDGDEFGVVFQVWRLDPAGSRCVYRAYVYDPDGEAEPEAAARTITGPAAAQEAAELFGVSPSPLLALEDDSSPVSDELGVIGTPFDPWLEPFGLLWPDL
ncbi:hypothetical protein MUG78_05240 [Gordonia alkaliphila]|uniref:hypothetical protein n=1 Tax=Gordonia alkaliphila TaxID=1053547 RepID=UPI001FF2F305|nr:hypothetical protein [Gordonia alkaliphila]MCK0438885.1 hypothetical protein [Gordonia alkaliphila]